MPITTGSKKIDNLTEGGFRNGISVIYAQKESPLSILTQEFAEEHDTTVISTLRADAKLTNTLPDTTHTVYDDSITIDSIQKNARDRDSIIIIESNEIPVQELTTYSFSNDTPIVVICTQPADDLLYTANLAIELYVERSTEDIRHRLVVRQNEFGKGIPNSPIHISIEPMIKERNIDKV